MIRRKTVALHTSGAPVVFMLHVAFTPLQVPKQNWTDSSPAFALRLYANDECEGGHTTFFQPEASNFDGHEPG